MLSFIQMSAQVGRRIWPLRKRIVSKGVGPQSMSRLRPDRKVTQLKRDTRVLVEDFRLLRRKHYRPHASLSGVRCGGRSVRRPVNLDPIIARGQVRDHPVKAVRAQGRLVERKVTSVQRVERGARGSNRLEQVRTDLDVPILVGYREIRR